VQHSLIVPPDIVRKSNVGLAVSPQVGGATHCISLVAITTLPIVPPDMYVVPVELSL
jgi:hypothetical protein